MREGALIVAFCACGRIGFDRINVSDDGSASPGDDAANVSDSWWDDNWQQRIRISFNNASSSETLSNFPVLVSLSSATIDYSLTGTGGQELRFVDGDNSSLLSHEIEVWDQGGTSAAWVRVPQIDAASSVDHIWLYYGNTAAVDATSPASVWQSGYVGVWHLSESPANDGIFEDSTANGLDGIYADGDATSDSNAPGIAGGGVRLSGDKDSIDVGDSPALQITGSMTIEAWVRPDTFRTDVPKIVSKLGFPPGRSYRLEIFDSTRVPHFAISADGMTTLPNRAAATPLPTTQFTHLAGVYDAAVQTLDIYVNGLLDNGPLQGTVPSSQSADNGHTVVIGDRGFDGGILESMAGSIDEVRISNVARSADWIAAVFRADAFVALGAPELLPAP